jgi:hypothetical protein
MQKEILNRIKELGGNIDFVTGKSLEDDLLSIKFNTVLYQKPTDRPWETAEESEPIYGLGEFVDENIELYKTDKKAFYDKMIEKYYCLTKEGLGQMFWTAELFTPFKEGTADFEEWNSYFECDELINLEEIRKHTNEQKPDFIQLFYSYGFPDTFYVCLSDPNPENPTLFGTDHEVFFNEITNEGTLKNLLQTFMTKSELIEIVKKTIHNL